MRGIEATNSDLFLEMLDEEGSRGIVPLMIS